MVDASHRLLYSTFKSTSLFLEENNAHSMNFTQTMGKHWRKVQKCVLSLEKASTGDWRGEVEGVSTQLGNR